MKPQPKPPACSQCPAYEWGLGFVPPEGPPDAPVCLIGQGPGEMEAQFSRPFFPEAPSGRNLNHQLYQVPAQRGEVLLTNAVWCWLPKAKPRGRPEGNREPSSGEVAYCTRAHLFPFLRKRGFLEPSGKVIVTIGTPASRALMNLGPKESLDAYVGTFRQLDLRGRG